MDRPLRIAQVAPPLERVPPEKYGGTERVMYELIVELVRRGHDVTTFASGDSDVPGRLVPTVPVALRPADFKDDPMGFFLTTMLAVLDGEQKFDIIHSHLEWASLLLARASKTPVVATFHGRLDLPWSRELLASPNPATLVAISRSQASPHPDLDFTVVHNGLSLEGAPFDRRRTDALCFVGRIAREKGVVEAIEIARIVDRPLRIAAKVAPTGAEREFHEDVFLQALKAAGSSVEFIGEVTGPERDELLAESYAALMPGSWPEPFGLAAIEALACGTPVLARPVGGLTEIIRDGIDGFFGDDPTEIAYHVPDVETLDRRAIRSSVIERFSAVRMADEYEALYRRVLGTESNGDDRRFAGLKELTTTLPPKAG
ncbi:MAG TPA: glycosyltransferase family 4 protein [Candidatus Limnocylindrales bacterium]|nr:glycosyltransferase family 4 protein [Candidatus Limnocylindrales bacterium]